MKTTLYVLHGFECGGVPLRVRVFDNEKALNALVNEHKKYTKIPNLSKPYIPPLGLNHRYKTVYSEVGVTLLEFDSEADAALEMLVLNAETDALNNTRYDAHLAEIYRLRDDKSSPMDLMWKKVSLYQAKRDIDVSMHQQKIKNNRKHV
ncbi:MAG: hypothetical protein Q7K57_52370 [Burkholderiaceae bacterium]|nr:hypothetical protein [Burkholderiaceae bacterium]